MNQINVVPYIDVMLVLLVIFMVTAPLVQTSSIDLPTLGQSANPPPELPLQIIVRRDGSLAIRDMNRGESVEEPVTHRNFQQAVLAKIQPEQPILIAGDKDTPYQNILSVMDQLRVIHRGEIGLLVESAHSS